MNKEIKTWFTRYASAIAESVQYSWSDKFAREEVKRVTDKFLECIKGYIDWDNLTMEDCQDLGFVKWDSNNLMLIPLYLFPLLPIGIELTSILGDTVIYDGTNVCNDARYGCIAYGIKVKE